jgi:pimeloyl-ACP methyl ester carboxylesterase
LVTSKADVDAIAHLSAKSSPQATAQWVQTDMLLDLREQLSQITIPLLEIAPFDPQFDPEGSAKTPSAQAKQAYYASLLSGVASARVTVVQPSRHFIMYDQPQQLHTVLTGFFQTLR